MPADTTQTTKLPLLLRTSRGTPFRFDIHNGDIGHTLIIGPTKRGKSIIEDVTAEDEVNADQS